MARHKRYLWHVTSISNLTPIMIHGILPMLSRGRMKCVWLVSDGKLSWALRHVRLKRRDRGAPLIAVRVEVRDFTAHRWSRRGVYYSRDAVQSALCVGYRVVSAEIPISLLKIHRHH